MIRLNFPQTIERLRKYLSDLFNDWTAWANKGSSIGDGNNGDVLTSDGAGGISWQPAAGGSSEGGITGAIGSVGGVNLQVGDTIQARVLADSEFDTWRLDCYPSATVTVEVEVNGSPISTGGDPVISVSTTATGSTGSWAADTASQDDVILFRITALTGLVERVECALYRTS